MHTKWFHYHHDGKLRYRIIKGIPHDEKYHEGNHEKPKSWGENDDTSRSSEKVSPNTFITKVRSSLDKKKLDWLPS